MLEVFKEYKDIEYIIKSDLCLSSPEQCEYNPCIHTALDKYYKTMNNAMERCNDITRYYEDKEYARAYSLSCYSGGITVFYEKNTGCYYIFILGEDDGSWFIVEKWTFDKPEFITRLSQVLSIFNANFKN